jgi:hypothetical protein
MHFYNGFRHVVRLAQDVQACNAVRYAKMFAQLTVPVRAPQCTEAEVDSAEELPQKVLLPCRWERNNWW